MTRLEGLLLVRGVALDRLHQVRDQVVAPLELDVDLRPGVLHLVAQADEPVVDADRGNDRHERLAAPGRPPQHANHSIAFLLRCPPAHHAARVLSEDTPSALRIARSCDTLVLAPAALMTARCELDATEHAPDDTRFETRTPHDASPWVTLALIADQRSRLRLRAQPVTGWPWTRSWLQWGFVPSRFAADPFSPAQLATIVTSMFLHAGWLHIGGNMLYLWIFGNNVEDRFGPAAFSLFYLVCGAAAALVQLLAAPEAAPAEIGASGAVAGVLGAYIVLFPGARVVTVIPVFFFIEVARLPAYLVIGFWFVLQLGSGLAALATDARRGRRGVVRAHRGVRTGLRWRCRLR